MRALALAGLVAVAALPSAGASAGSTRSPSPREAEIAIMEDSLMAAIATRDSLALERLLAPGFAYWREPSPENWTRRSASWTARAAWIQQTLTSPDSGQIRAIAVELRNQGATVRITLERAGTEGSDDTVTDRWERRNGRWRIVERQVVGPPGKFRHAGTDPRYRT